MNINKTLHNNYYSLEPNCYKGPLEVILGECQVLLWLSFGKVLIVDTDTRVLYFTYSFIFENALGPKNRL